MFAAARGRRPARTFDNARLAAVADKSLPQGAGRIIEKPCKTCRGTGRRERTSKITLRIPAGVDTGSRLRSAGNGEAGFRGGPSGDLYVVLHVRPHEIFQRDGDDLLCEVPINFVQAALGAEIEVPALDGKTSIAAPPGPKPVTC